LSEETATLGNSNGLNTARHGHAPAVVKTNGDRRLLLRPPSGDPARNSGEGVPADDVEDEDDADAEPAAAATGTADSPELDMGSS